MQVDHLYHKKSYYNCMSNFVFWVYAKAFLLNTKAKMLIAPFVQDSTLQVNSSHFRNVRQSCVLGCSVNFGKRFPTDETGIHECQHPFCHVLQAFSRLGKSTPFTLFVLLSSAGSVLQELQMHVSESMRGLPVIVAKGTLNVSTTLT